ncbi:MAG: NADP-dependent malic enzyme [Candidatus Micrarchaeaceae archaeon]|nr:NADP-dependent malic enzyme [Candidatus Marsarchaeota archaeon]
MKQNNKDELKKISLIKHKKYRGKIQIIGKMKIKYSDLKIYYTPGVAYPCLEIAKNKNLSYEYTNRGNNVAIVTNGSRILGLGSIGPEAGMPVMEGKALLMKKFGAIDAIPLAINAEKENEIINFVKMIEPSFGAINIEDIQMPMSLRIVHKLRQELKIPVFYDDSDGTGIVARAALINAVKLVNKDINKISIVINGSGAAGLGIANILINSGIKNIIMCDTSGIIYKGRKENMNEFKKEISEKTNQNLKKGKIEDAVDGADVLIGASTKNAFSKELIQKMNHKAIVFALANPIPEISYNDAKNAGAAIVATGRSDFPNQINNFIAFTGILRGLLDVHAKTINNSMLIKASDALAGIIKNRELNSEYIIPKFKDEKTTINITAAIANEVAKEAMKIKATAIRINMGEILKRTEELFKNYDKIEKDLGE